MSQYRSAWRVLADARAEAWAHSADKRGWCKEHLESGTWVRAGECDEYRQARQTIALHESNRLAAPRRP